MVSLVNENNELRNEYKVTSTDMNKTQQKIVDSWLQVFRDFRDCFNSLTDVQNLISSFGDTNKTLSTLKDFQDEKECRKLRGIVFRKNIQSYNNYTKIPLMMIRRGGNSYV